MLLLTKSSFNKYYFAYGIFSLLVIFSFLLIPSQTTAASNGATWQSGNIIDDNVFYNNGSMNVYDIQNFLNTQGPSCDTWGTKPSEYGGGTRAQYGTSRGYPPPYICLKVYSENGVGSAQIIKQAADTYGISPKVILVTLQKEQRLVTDEWPWPNQYKSAMGYGCPDTAACDSQYYGFYNQVTNAARQFRNYANNPDNYRYKPNQTNYVQYNPNSACGGSNVYIENKATAGLYNYTPYQPNASAQAAAPGQEVNCGAYGNLNFWRYYRDWFGRTTYLFGAIPSSKTSYAKSPCTIPNYSPNQVGRLYNPDTVDYLYTTNRNEACNAIKLGYIWDDIALQNDHGKPATIPIYRLRIGSTHSYTASPTERAQLLSSGYQNEGIIFYGHSSNVPGTLPVYQLGAGSGSKSSHFLTAAGNEGTYFISELGFESRGIGFYSSGSAVSSPVFRLKHGNTRFYTVLSSEANTAVSRYRYVSEGTTLKADSRPGQHSRPVYRLNGWGGKLYTTSRGERDSAVINFGYHAEGTGFYSYSPHLSGANPVYRSTNYSTKSRLYTQYLGEYYNSRTLYGYNTEGISWYGIP